MTLRVEFNGQKKAPRFLAGLRTSFGLNKRNYFFDFCLASLPLPLSLLDAGFVFLVPLWDFPSPFVIVVSSTNKE